MVKGVDQCFHKTQYEAFKCLIFHNTNTQKPENIIVEEPGFREFWLEIRLFRLTN